MVVGGYDKIDFSMKKLGIEEFYRYGDAPVGLPGGDGPGVKTGKNSIALMTSSPEISGYHIVLLPCAAMGYSQKSDTGSSGFLCGGPTAAGAEHGGEGLPGGAARGRVLGICYGGCTRNPGGH